jgi:3-oxoadipate enol-lactonase
MKHPMNLLGSGVRAMARWGAGDLSHIVPTPAGRVVEFNAGSTYVTMSPEPFVGAPRVVLLHGLACTGALCWALTFHELARRAQVITFDQRWHGRGVDSDRFTIEGCADDVAGVLDALDIDDAIVAGYSLGGAIAQMTWRRHPEHVQGLVLCSTAPHHRGGPAQRVLLPVLRSGVATLEAQSARRISAHLTALNQDDAGPDSSLAWVKNQVSLTSAWAYPHVISAVTGFDSASWVGDIDVPTAVVVTDKDRAIPTRLQLALASAIPDATVLHAPGGHASLILDSARWLPVFLEAVESVASRIEARSREQRR